MQQLLQSTALSTQEEIGLISADIPSAFKFLFGPERYIVAYGGRGSGKSQNTGRRLLIKAISKKCRVLCTRELQASIKDSVHRSLADEIDKLKMNYLFEVQQAAILARETNSDFLFKGLRHNIAEIKSTVGVTDCWVEEAQATSRTSWEILIPTIREEGSQFYITFNPELEEDETYQRFVINPPRDSVVRKVNWRDNPWFPNVLRLEKDELEQRDIDAYLNIWEGQCRQALEGAIYAKELRAAQSDGRLTKVPYDAIRPVDVFADLGWSDNTSLWYIQRVGLEFRVLQAYQSRQQTWNHYLQHMQSRGYVIGTVWLPHDAKPKTLATGRSIYELTLASGFKAQIVPNLSVTDGINAARLLFASTWFDQEKCADGLQALRRYRYDVDPDTRRFSDKPLHDEFSHYADAFRYFGVAMSDGARKKPALPKVADIAVGAGWMRR